MSELDSHSLLKSNCWHCLAIGDYCAECADSREATDADVAHQIVDERADIYHHAMSKRDADVSGHDWIASITRKSDGSTREEFTEAIVNPADRLPTRWFLGKHIHQILDEDEFESMLKVRKGMTVCESCHYEINAHSVCPNCN